LNRCPEKGPLKLSDSQITSCTTARGFLGLPELFSRAGDRSAAERPEPLFGKENGRQWRERGWKWRRWRTGMGLAYSQRGTDGPTGGALIYSRGCASRPPSLLRDGILQQKTGPRLGNVKAGGRRRSVAMGHYEFRDASTARMGTCPPSRALSTWHRLP